MSTIAEQKIAVKFAYPDLDNPSLSKEETEDLFISARQERAGQVVRFTADEWNSYVKQIQDEQNLHG